MTSMVTQASSEGQVFQEDSVDSHICPIGVDYYDPNDNYVASLF
jgi:hypothetical protein